VAHDFLNEALDVRQLAVRTLVLAVVGLELVVGEELFEGVASVGSVGERQDRVALPVCLEVRDV